MDNNETGLPLDEETKQDPRTPEEAELERMLKERLHSLRDVSLELDIDLDNNQGNNPDIDLEETKPTGGDPIPAHSETRNTGAQDSLPDSNQGIHPNDEEPGAVGALWEGQVHSGESFVVRTHLDRGRRTVELKQHGWVGPGMQLDARYLDEIRDLLGKIRT